MQTTTTETLYKVIDVNTGKVLKSDLDFYAGRAFMGDRDDVTMTEMTTDITDALRRRNNLIAVQEADQSPVVDRMTVERVGVKLSVDMQLASVPVTIHGEYNVQTNTYAPADVTVKTNLLDKFYFGQYENLETFSTAMGWSFAGTKAAIQEAVRNR